MGAVIATRWKVVTLPSGFIPSIVTDDEKEIHITGIAGYSRTDTQDLEHAHQIVQAVNTHDALCSALENVNESLGMLRDSGLNDVEIDVLQNCMKANAAALCQAGR